MNKPSTSHTRTAIAVILLGVCVAALSACNTLAGLGKDLTYLGERGESPANE